MRGRAGWSHIKRRAGIARGRGRWHCACIDSPVDLWRSGIAKRTKESAEGLR